MGMLEDIMKAFDRIPIWKRLQHVATEVDELKARIVALEAALARCPAEVLVAVSTSRLSCKTAGKTRILMPVWDSSGESRISRAEAGQCATLPSIRTRGRS
jgi:hypothetical protein